MRKIIVTRDPAKINLAVLKLVEQLGDLTSLSALASDAEYARSQAVAAAAAAQADQTAAAAAKAGAEAAQASAASNSGTAGAHASAAAASAGISLAAASAASGSATEALAAKTGSEGARDASVTAKDQSQAAKVASEAARDVVQSSIYIGPTAPTVTRSGMVWVDETANDIKIRNAANTAWQLLSDMIGALEYDRALTLTAGQKTQGQTNLGLTALARTLISQATGDGMFGSMGAQLTFTGGHMFAKFPNGLILQGGIRTSNGTDGYVPFGAAFATACFGVVVSPYDVDSATNVLAQTTTFGWSVTGFSMRGRWVNGGVGNVGAGGYTASYIAFGI